MQTGQSLKKSKAEGGKEQKRKPRERLFPSWLFLAQTVKGQSWAQLPEPSLRLRHRANLSLAGAGAGP